MNYIEEKGEAIRGLVQEQYENFPYPVGEPDLHQFIRAKASQGGCPSRCFHWYWPHGQSTDDLDILVAGCGTTQAPKFAVNLPNARITAIDISERSLKHTGMLMEKHGVRNIALHQMPIERIPDLGKTFDLIISTGVLHHLPEPAEGLRALRSVLRSDGSMYLMLYAKYGRDGVYYLQNLFRRLGLSAGNATEADLEGVASLVGMLPPYHALAAKREFFHDLRAHIELVDLFLHPQDRPYSIPDIYSLLDDCGMKVQKMLFRAHYEPVCSDLKESPFFERMQSLPSRERFAIGELFRAASIMHFFVGCRDDRDESSYTTNIRDEKWKQLIPVRHPSASLKTMHTPDGKKMVIFCSAHQFQDIYYPVDPMLHHFFNSIDDSKTAGELVDAMSLIVGQPHSEQDLQKFLEDLETFDYIWFRREPMS